MANEPARPGQVIVLPLADRLCTSKTTMLAKTADLELIRLVLPAGKELPTHKAPGEITVQCLEGCVAFTAHGQTQELCAGDLVHLAAGEPHALRGIVDASLLITVLLTKVKSQPPHFDVVQESSEESFPASDPPADHRH